tara:strand:- start:794 stop:994 length:201 start_codon:yes stop_codon:yes gene_type:complete
MKLSDQALGALMMALQKSLIEQTDIVPVLKDMNFETEETEETDVPTLVITNPPVFSLDDAVFNDEA